MDCWILFPEIKNFNIDFISESTSSLQTTAASFSHTKRWRLHKKMKRRAAKGDGKPSYHSGVLKAVAEPLRSQVSIDGLSLVPNFLVHPVDSMLFNSTTTMAEYLSIGLRRAATPETVLESPDSSGLIVNDRLSMKRSSLAVDQSSDMQRSYNLGLDSVKGNWLFLSVIMNSVQSG